ncbi:MAG: hypothetical protein C4527_12185 [Candidatus Omnitrophota bacterium]|nr:MAG: hypothetical protein C4527_12185 [Candidatus Omnitrophota bacterium]
MNTIEEITRSLQQLTPDKRQMVADYINAVKDESFQITRFSDEEMEMIDHDIKEAEQGINVSPKLKGQEAIDYLTQAQK